MKHSKHILKTLTVLSVVLAMPYLTRAAGTDVWIGAGGSQNLFWLSTANWANVPPALPQVGDQLVFSNSVGLVNSNNYPAATTFSGITFATPSGGFALSGASVTLANNITDLQVVTPEAVNLPVIVNSPLNLNLNVTPNGVLNLNNVISGTGNLTNSGGGTVNLTGNNSISGQLVINAGTVVVSAETNLPAPAAAPATSIVLNGGILKSLNNLTLNTNRGFLVGSPTASGGSGTIQTTTNVTTVFPTVTFGGVIADNAGGAGGLAKLGFGGLTLFNQNTYSGTTSNQVGLLTLDFSQGTSPQYNVINPVSALVMGGANAGVGNTNFAQLQVTGKASTVNTQAFASAHVTIGQARITVTSGATGGEADLTLNALDHDSGGVLTMVLPSNAGGTGNIRTTSANLNGILGGWATISDGQQVGNRGWLTPTNWACVDVNSNIVNFTNYMVYNTATALMKNYMNISSNIYVTGIAGGAPPTGYFTNDLNGAGSVNEVNSIFFNSIGGAFFINSNNVIRLGKYGGLFKYDTGAGNPWAFGGTNAAGFPTGPGAMTNANQLSYGTITAGGPGSGNPGEIVLFNTSTGSGSANNWCIECSIADNGPGGTVSVIKAGPGYTKLRNHNTFSGGFYILGGRIQPSGTEIGTDNLRDAFGTGTNGIYIFPGGTLFWGAGAGITNNAFIAGNGSAEEPGLGALRGGGYLGNITLIGDAQIAAGNIVGPISGPFNLILCASSTAAQSVSLQNASNSWSGNTTIIARDGATSAQILTSSNNEVIPNGFGKGNVTMQGVAGQTARTIWWNLNGFNETINGLSSVNSLAGGVNCTCIITNGSASASTLTVGDNDQGGTFGGAIIAGTGVINLTKIGGGVETLTNTDNYTGTTTVSNGVLQLTGLGSIASSPTVTIKGGSFDVSSLNYTIPAGQTINAIGGTFQIGGSGSGTSSGGPVNFTNGTLRVNSLNVGSANLSASTVNLSSAGTTNFIQPASIQPLGAYPDTFPIVSYNTLNGDTTTLAAALPAGYTGYVTNVNATATIYLVLTSGPVTPFLTWFGSAGGALNSSWDFITSDWTNTVTHAPSSYSDGAIVSFDDGGKTNLVNLTTTFTPLGLTVSNSVTYTFVGVGNIAGTNGLTKLGSGTLILDNTNADAYTGGLNIGAGGKVQVGVNDAGGSLGAGSVAVNGSLVFIRTNSVVVGNGIGGSGSITELGTNSTLVLSNNNSFSGTILVTNNSLLVTKNPGALGTTTSLTTIANGSSLDVSGSALSGGQVVVSGIGVLNNDGSTNGAIYNSGLSAGPPSVRQVTLQGDTVFGCPPTSITGTSLVYSNRWDIRGTGASLTANGFNITKVGYNQVTLSGVAVDSTLGDIDVKKGMFSVETATTGLGNPANTLTIESGASLSLFNATNLFNKKIALSGGGIGSIYPGTLNVSSGNNTIIGSMTVTGSVVVSFRTSTGGEVSGSLTLSNAISGSGSLDLLDTNSTLTLAGPGNADNHTGGTIIDGSTSVGGVTFIMNTINPNTANGLVENAVGASGSINGVGVVTPPLNYVGGNGTNAGEVSIGSVLWPGVGGKFSTFGSGTLDTQPGGSGPLPEGGFVWSLGTVTNAGGGFNDLLNVNGDVDTGGSPPIFINPVGLLTTNGVYTLVRYTGTLQNGFGGVPHIYGGTASRYSFSRDQSVPGIITLKVLTGVGTMEWNGTVANNQWDVQTSLNWTNLATATPSSPNDYQFYQSDQVFFDNSIIASGGTNVISITNGTVVLPSTITVNSTTNYTIQGAGSIGGGATILKTNSSTLTISSANSFSGTVTIAGGTLLVNNTNNALGSVSAAVIVTNGGTLDVGGPSFAAGTPLLIAAAKPVYISGMGVNNLGAIINSSANQQESAFENLTLAGDAAIGGNGSRWDVGRPSIGTGVFSTGGNPYNLYKVGSNYVAFLGLTVDTNLANIDVGGGILAFQQACSSMGNPSSNLTVEAGATLDLYNSTTNMQIFTKQFVLNGNGVTANITNENGATTINGNMTLNGSCVIGASSTGLTNNCVISGSGSLTKNGGTVVFLTTNETYTGNTTVSAGTLSLVGIASIASSTNITVMGGATVDVASRVNATLTLNGGASQTLTAVNPVPTNNATTVSTINGNLTNSVGCTLSLNPNATNFVILTVTTNATLSGTTLLKISQGDATNDVLNANGNLVYGGTLTITNLAGTLGAGNSYKIFNAGVYVPSTFSTINLPALSSGLVWNTTTLAVNGTISVVSTSLIPTNSPGIVGFTLVNPNVVINGTNGQQGGTYYLLQSTDAALPFIQWTPASTNVVNTNGDVVNSFTFTGTNVVNTNAAQQFYILSNTNNH